MIRCSVSLKLLLLTLPLWSLLIPACTTKLPMPSPIIVGTLYNLSGGQAGLDLPSYRGAMLAAEQINRSGGLGGRELVLMLLDGMSDPAILSRKAEQQMQMNLDTASFLGLSDTDMVLAAAPVAVQYKRVLLTSGATSPKLPSQVPDFLFMACFGDNVQAAAAADFAFRHKKARSAAVVYDSTQSYTRLLQGYFIERFEQLGGKVLSVRGYEQGDLNSAVEQLPAADLVFLAAMPQDALPAVKLIRQAGFSMPVIGGDGFDSETIWQGQTGVTDVFYTTHAYLKSDNPDQKVLVFRAAYLEKYSHEPDGFAALGYDAVNLMALAISRAENPEPGAILEAMGAIDNFEGVTGKISFASGSRIPQKSVTIMEVKEGVPGLVMQLLPDRIPAP